MMHRWIRSKLLGSFLVCVFLVATMLSVEMEKPMNTYAAEKNREIAIGSTITFGSYEQDNDPEDGCEPLEWIVLDQKEDSVLLLSRYVIDCKRYHSENIDITWENCDLRDWLNYEFFRTAFSEEQQEQIMVTHVKNSDNKWYDNSYGGNDTYDRVFLLSLEEVGKYTGSGMEREMVIATKYAQEQRVRIRVGCADWWLRSPGLYANWAAYIVGCSGVNQSGIPVNSDNDGVFEAPSYIGVRPALWMKLD